MNLKQFAPLRARGPSHLFLILTLIFLNSCAHNEKNLSVSNKPFLKDKNPEEIRSLFLDNLKQSCFSSTGKGKVEHDDKNYSFSYEAKLSFEKNQWAIGFNVPFSGEETLVFEWNKKDRLQSKLKGSFYETILNEIMKMEKEVATQSILRLRNLKDLQANFFFYFEKLFTNSEMECFVVKNDHYIANGECYQKNDNEKQLAFLWEYSQEYLTINLKNNLGYAYQLKLDNLENEEFDNDKKFHNLEIRLVKENSVEKEIKLTLFASTCH